MTALQGLDRLRATYPVVLERGARRRFETELRTLADVPTTAGLLPVAGGGFDGDGHPYVERALDGLPPLESLGLRVRRDGRPLDVDMAVAAIEAVLEGLTTLHRAGLVHGGVRPDVVLDGPTGPVLADPVPLVVAARVGALGPAFAAPEVLQGEVPTPESDVYAVAATLVHLATGRGPWTDADADAEDVLLQMMSAPQPEIGVLAAHAGVAAAVVQALAGDPAARPDAIGLARALSRGVGTAAGGVVSGTDRLDTVPPFVRHVPVAPTATPDDPTIVPASGTPLGSRYRLHERIGSGATGTVYRATCHPRPSGSPNGLDATGVEPTEVAVKVLREELADDPNVVARFLGERTTLVGLDHPNLVRVRDLVAEGSTLAIVMDLVDGPDLRRWMRTVPALPPAAACRLLAQLAGALAAVHAAGVVHRDLKPENVLLARVGTSDLQTRLTDFGVARSVRVAAARLTQHGQVVGTPAYLAPEVTAGTPAAPPADVYGFGMLAYELLAGCRPYADDHPLALAQAHATLAPGRPPGIDDRLWRVLDSCLAKGPASRPTAGTLAALLLDCATAIGDDAPPIPRLDVPPPAVPITGSPISGTLPPPGVPNASSTIAAATPSTGSEAATPSASTATTPPGTSTPPHPDRAPDGRPPGDDPDDRLVTDVGTAPPPPRPPAEKPGGDRRRRLYLWGAAAFVLALAAGVAIGVLTMERRPDEDEAPAEPVATVVYLRTTGARADPENVNLLFEPLSEANGYRVIRDPAAPDGHVDMNVPVAEGASFVPIADPQNDQSHCYVVQAIVFQDPSSTTTTTRPLFMDPYQYCPDGPPPSAPPPG